MSLTLGLSTAISGLQVSQRSLDLISHNIANVNTEGYSRKSVFAESRVLAGRGAGVQIAAIQRTVDDNLRKDLRTESGNWANAETLDAYYSRIQDLFGRPGDNTTFSHLVGTFGQSLESLATSPDMSSTQWETVSAANDLALSMNTMSKQLQTLRLNADKEITLAIQVVNERLADVQTLNDKIVREQAVGHEIGDLEDQRDQALAEISDYMDIQTFVRDDNTVVIFTGQGRTLLDSQTVSLSHTAANTIQSWMTKAGGDIAPIYVGANDITKEIGSGRMKALIDMRDTIIPNLQAEMDEVSHQLKKEINQIHNAGSGFPNLTSTFSGTRFFVDSATQTMRYTDGDTVLTLYDSDGAQSARTTINTLMVAAGETMNGDWVIDDVATAMQTWIQANGAGTATVAVAADGQFDIDLRSTTLGLAMRDESSDSVKSMTFDASTTVPGSAGNLVFYDPSGAAAIATIAVGAGDSIATIASNIDADPDLVATLINEGDGIRIRVNHATSGQDFLIVPSTTALRDALGFTGDAQDATISFDADGNGTMDETGIKGFSNFLGLNDFFVTDRPHDLHESAIQSKGWTAPAGGTWSLGDLSSGIGGLGSITIAAGASFTQIVSAINNANTNAGVTANTVTGITASMVPEGSGYRLRLITDTGEELQLTQTAGTLLTSIGMEAGASGTASNISVRSDIKSAPSMVARGQLQYSSDTGEYYLGTGDNTTALALAERMTTTLTFRTAGNISVQTMTFESYATNTVSDTATRVDNNSNTLSYLTNLKESLYSKDAAISAVNLDEEMAQLIVFQQSYIAAAKMISTTQTLFEVLNGIIR
ncbi:putative Flagellar hook-associated protein [Rhodospirillaceae bacterium LM-1]|nr:putative Flagellar hook-associated protein [Rhodospirillaceae bacterium LM-1]